MERKILTPTTSNDSTQSMKTREVRSATAGLAVLKARVALRRPGRTRHSSLSNLLSRGSNNTLLVEGKIEIT